MATAPDVRYGTSSTGMEDACWGDGDRTLLYIGGGPGSQVPRGRGLGYTGAWFEPFTDAGYRIHHVTRRRGMPPGHTTAHMADDFAGYVEERMGGRADLVVGVSFGGMLALLLAARRGELLGRAAVVAAAGRVSPFAQDVDRRLLAALEQRRRAASGSAFAEYVLPGRRWSLVRRAAGPVIGRWLLAGTHHPVSDLVVEVGAELAHDARPELPRIDVPVVLLCGDADVLFTWPDVEETSRLVPECDLVRYPGRGHAWVASTRQVPVDVMDRLGGVS